MRLNNVNRPFQFFTDIIDIQCELEYKIFQKATVKSFKIKQNQYHTALD